MGLFNRGVNQNCQLDMTHFNMVDKRYAPSSNHDIMVINRFTNCSLFLGQRHACYQECEVIDENSGEPNLPYVNYSQAHRFFILSIDNSVLIFQIVKVNPPRRFLALVRLVDRKLQIGTTVFNL